MPLWLQIVNLVATVLLGGGLFDTRRKIKAERVTRQENSDVQALDECAKLLISARRLYHQRRSRRPWQRTVSDEALQAARMNLHVAANRLSSPDLVPVIDNYHDIAGQFAARAIEVNTESEELAYQSVMATIGNLRREALNP